MIRHLLLLAFLSVSFSCERIPPPEIKIYGSLKKVMAEGDLSGKVSLKEFEGKENLYAIGALENLQGEIMIYDGEPFVTKAEGQKEGILTEFNNHRASLLATAIVHDWQAIQIPDTVQFIDELESFIRSKLKEMPELPQAIPFRIEGIADFIEWHVINWNTDIKEHSHKLHKENAIKGYKQYIGVDIIGFYSEKPGLITHKRSLTHMHVKTIDNHISGHLDKLKLKKGEAVLYLPEFD